MLVDGSYVMLPHTAYSLDSCYTNLQCYMYFGVLHNNCVISMYYQYVSMLYSLLVFLLHAFMYVDYIISDPYVIY